MANDLKGMFNPKKIQDDFTGQTINGLYVISRIYKKIGEIDYPTQKYNIRCVCGKEFMLDAPKLKKGTYKSCGCLSSRERKINYSMLLKKSNKQKITSFTQRDEILSKREIKARIITEFSKTSPVVGMKLIWKITDVFPYVFMATTTLNGKKYIGCAKYNDIIADKDEATIVAKEVTA